MDDLEERVIKFNDTWRSLNLHLLVNAYKNTYNLVNALWREVKRLREELKLMHEAGKFSKRDYYDLVILEGET